MLRAPGDGNPTALGTQAETAYTYGVDAGVGETDNVTLVSTDKISQTIAVADVDFSLKQQSRLLNADAKGNFSYLDFLQGAYGRELIGRLDGVARFALIPEKMILGLAGGFWAGAGRSVHADDAHQSRERQLREHGTRSRPALGVARLRGRDGTLCANAIPDESVRQQPACRAALPLGRAISAGSTIALEGSVERVLFDNTVDNTDFDRSSIYGRYEAQGARTELAVNLGATKVEQGNESITGPLAKLQLSRKLSAAAKLTFTAGRDLIDAARAFSALQGGAIGAIGATPVTGIGTAPAAVTSNNYTVTYASVGWQYARNRTTFGVSGQWEKDSYQGQPLLDLNRGTAQFSVERQLTQRIHGTAHRQRVQDQLRECRLRRDRWIGRRGIDVPRGSGARDPIALRTRIPCGVGHRQRIYRESSVFDGGL